MERIELHDGKEAKTIENPGPGLMIVRLMTNQGGELVRFTLNPKNRLIVKPSEWELADYIEVEK